MQVKLANRGSTGTAPDRWANVATYEAASALCREYISFHGLGASQWEGGAIRDEKTRKVIAYVSYNGRVWKGGRFQNSNICLYSPYQGEHSANG